MFDEKYQVSRAALIPIAVVHDRCKLVQHTNSYKFMLTNDVWDDGAREGRNEGIAGGGIEDLRQCGHFENRLVRRAIALAEFVLVDENARRPPVVAV